MSPTHRQRSSEIKSLAQGHTASGGRSTEQHFPPRRPCPASPGCSELRTLTSSGPRLSSMAWTLACPAPSGSPPLSPAYDRVPLVPLQLHQRLWFFHPVANSVQKHLH